MSNNQIKPNLSLNTIGTKRFIAGILIGLSYAIILFVLFTYLREFDQYFAFFSYNNVYDLNSNNELLIYWSYIFTALALGMPITIYIWSNGLGLRGRANKFIQTQSFFIVWMVLFAYTSIARFNPEVMGYQAYSNIFIVPEYYQILLFLVPLYIFLYSWQFLIKRYKSQKWMLISLVVILFLGLVFKNAIPIPNKDRLKNQYALPTYIKNQKIDSTLLIIKNQYNIEYLKRDINSLKTNHSLDSYHLMDNIHKWFHLKEDTLNLKTIIMARLLTQFKPLDINYRVRENFKLPNPYAVLNQMKKYNKQSNEYKELCLFLDDEAQYINEALTMLKTEHIYEASRSYYVREQLYEYQDYLFIIATENNFQGPFLNQLKKNELFQMNYRLRNQIDSVSLQ